MTPVARQTAIGLMLAALIFGGWTALHVWGVFFQPLSGPLAWLAPAVIGLQTWLGAGMFIVAHDAMHGSLAPGRPRLNFVIGQACVGAYAAFDYRKLRTAHHGHHRSPGGPDDPDFHVARPDAFWPWFLRFFTTYFGWRELAVLTAVFWIWLLAFKADPLNLALFWGLPSILSALQLFIFGTWLPHRHAAAAPGFADHHNARTIPMPWIASLATCFHFGLHHEHHLTPSAPWWRLPRVRREFLDRARQGPDPTASDAAAPASR